MALVTITADNFQKEIAQTKGTVLVDFWAAWCGPCQMLSPVVDEVAAEREDITVGKVNVDEQQSLAMEYNIMSIPTLLVFKDGEEVKRSLGVISKDEILELLA